VGKTAQIKLADLTGRYIGQPFENCSCMGLVKDVCQALGADFPDEFKGLTLDNYMDFWRQDRGQAIETMRELLITLGRPAPLDQLRIGDLLVVEQPGGGQFPAVYVGRGHAIASFLRTGVEVFKLGGLQRPVMARRLI